MLVGVPREIKNHEYRVGLTLAGVRELIDHDHQVMVQADAGAAIGLGDELYRQAGATIVDNAEEIYIRADMIIKVKEPQPDECKLLRPNQVLFAYLHLAADPDLARRLIDSGAICIAYETVTDEQCTLPLLTPMSEVAGRMAVQEGAHSLQKTHGGSGVLLSGVPGVESGNVMVIGAGVVGLNAARIAMSMGADVTLLDRSLPRLQQIDDLYGDRLNTLFSNIHTIEEQLATADLVIGAVLVPGGATPKLVTRDMLRLMKPGSVMVDVAIDQGGCFETSHATTHEEPTYTVDGIIHYCVPNMPSGVARTSTFALTNATLPFVLTLADKGATRALRDDPHLLNGLNVCGGSITHPVVARDLGYPCEPALRALQPTAA